MRYTTTKCRNCGYKTRNHESGVPRVQLGQPIFKCPGCGHLILDSIATEYEFMTEKERENLSSEKLKSRSAIGGIIRFTFGLIFLIGGCLYPEVAAGLIFLGILTIAISISITIKNSCILKEKGIEQAIYESLVRTSNKEYVEILGYSYKNNNSKRKYLPFADKDNFINEYKYFEENDDFSVSMKKFNDVLPILGTEEPSEIKYFTINTH